MLCSRLNKILHIRSLIPHHSQLRSFGVCKSKCSWRNFVFGAFNSEPMSSYKLRLILRDFTVARLLNACFRTQLVSSVVRRCRRERGRGIWVCFRQTLFRPSRTLLLSAAAASPCDDEDQGAAPCSQDISDEDLEALVHDFEGVDELSRTTLFCEGCQRRVIIDKKHPGVVYCSCTNTHPPKPSADGWVPYMEADDVIIWRKEYKPGGLFAYKVYGRYKDLTASDFAMIQVDGAYRRSWDDAVAALSIVESEANGVRSQTVLHWEVLWPRLFANRDYVYLRRHKEFQTKSKCLAHKEAIFSGLDLQPCETPPREERPSVHSRAKRKAQEMERLERRGARAASLEDKLNKVYVIVSRSCTHPDAPETRNAIRVQEYWSHMVVRTIDGTDKMGMEFVLTYYDEPSVGGLPSGVSAWATGRAAPSYLARMRRAARLYAQWRAHHHERPDFEPFDCESSAPRPVEYRKRGPRAARPAVDERDMESSTRGPELDGGYEPRDKSTQTDGRASRDVGIDTKQTSNESNGGKNKFEEDRERRVSENVKMNDVKVTGNAKASERVAEESKASKDSKEANNDKTKEEQTEEPKGEETQKSSWWRYLYPFYYFV